MEEVYGSQMLVNRNLASHEHQDEDKGQGMILSKLVLDGYMMQG